MILAALLLSIQPARPEALSPPPRPPAGFGFHSYVSNWRTRYSIDGQEVDYEEMRDRFGGIEPIGYEVEHEMYLRWVHYRTKGKR